MMTRRCLLSIVLGLLAGSWPACAQEAANAAAAPANPQTEAKPAFDILDFQIDGNTVLDDMTLEKAVYGFMGPDKTLEDVEKARAALQEAYNNAGYPTVLVAIPDQDVNDAGRVRLEVVEGSIETTHITGSRYYALDKIREALPGLAEGQVPHMPSVQTQMTALSQQTPDRTVTPIFRAGSTPGKMEVELRVKDELPLHASLELNTRNTSNTSYLRMIGTVRYDNLWQKFHSASLQYLLSPEDVNQVQMLTGTYMLPTGWSDTRLSLYAMSINSNTAVPGIQVGDLAVIGSGSIYGARLYKPLLTEAANTQTVSFGMDYKSFGTTTTTNVQVDYLKFITGFDGAWRSDWTTTTLNLAGHFSIRGLVNDANQFAAKRVNATGQGASPNFMYLAGSFKNQMLLPWDLMLQTRMQGQASSTFLINNEQFSAGGPLSVRGYHQSQVLADNGLNLSMEIHSPQFFGNEYESIQNFRALVFAEWAGLWSSNQPPTPNRATLASTGMGLRLKMYKSLTGEFDWSYPLETYQSLTARVGAGQQRIDFRMLYEF